MRVASAAATIRRLLLGKSVWQIFGGKPAGSVVLLGLGMRIRRDRPLKNPARTILERHFDSEISIMAFCAWRVRYGRELVGSWRDDNRTGGPMLRALQRLRSKPVERVSVGSGVTDLTIAFGDGLYLDILPDIRDPDESDINYKVRYPGGVIVCGNTGQLEHKDTRKRHAPGDKPKRTIRVTI